MRLVVRPGDSLTVIDVLPIASQRSLTLATVSSLVASPRTSSTSFILCTGLKKCIPMKRSGAGTDAAISVTLRADVLLAMMALSTIRLAACITTAFLIASCSETVSTSRLAPTAASDKSALTVSRSRAARPFSSLTLPNRTPSPNILSTLAYAFSRAAALVSTNTVSKPELAKAWAIPVPIRPAPTTNTLLLLSAPMIKSLLYVFFTDHVAERTNTLDGGFRDIPWTQETSGSHANTGRRSGEENISAGGTRPRMHESNQLAHIPGHVGRCSVLTYFAVYRQCQTQLGRTLWKLILGDNPRPYTRGAILAFGRKQIHANTFGAATLQISRTDVIAHGIAEHTSKRVLQIDLAAADHRHKLHLMIQLLGEWWITDWIIRANQGTVGLEESERLEGCVKP